MNTPTKRLEKIPFTQSFTRNYPESESYGKNRKITVHIRFNDECNNGHNSFSITGEIGRPGARDIDAGGCIHEDISKYFPELHKFIRWHLTSSDGPMHYIENTVFHAKDNNLQSARNTAIWPDATLEQLQDKKALKDRLPALLASFEKEMIELRNLNLA